MPFGMPLASRPARLPMPPETLTSWIRHWAEAAPERAAVISSDGRLLFTYRALAAHCESLARGLKQLGVQPGEVIALQLPNTADFVALYMAIGMCGAVVQTVHMSYRRADIEPLLRHSGAALVIVEPQNKGYPVADELLKARDQISSLRAVITTGSARIAGALALDDLAAQGMRADVMLKPPRADDTFVLLYTSGTTAQPKGVPATYRHFLSNARLSAVALALDSESRLLSAAPFTHLYGLFTLHMALYAGACVVLLPSFTPNELTEALRLSRPTALFTAPAHVATCFVQGLFDRDALSSLRLAVTSGSLCPVPLAAAMQELMPGGSFIQLWGMSELQAGAFARPEDSAATRLTSAGRASPDTELRIANADGDILAAGREGELQVRGGSVFAGYLNNAAANTAAFTADGWFRTGDLARLDSNGSLYITGRIKDLINRGGVKINPTDTELVLSKHPAVQQCALVPVPDDVLGEKICCVLHLKPGHQQPTLAALLDWLQQQGVSKIYWPERLEFVDAMPLTPTRKIIKARLVEDIVRPVMASAAA
jgi:cyclohexanecarboxylate-CoA ligase